MREIKSISNERNENEMDRMIVREKRRGEKREEKMVMTAFRMKLSGIPK